MTLTAPNLPGLLSQLTDSQKWEAFQFLWTEVVDSHADEIVPPAWHDAILKERHDKIERGEAEWIGFDQAMDELHAELACK